MNTANYHVNSSFNDWFAYLRSLNWTDGQASNENTRLSFLTAMRLRISRSKAYFEVADKLHRAGHALNWGGMHKLWFAASKQLNSPQMGLSNTAGKPAFSRPQVQRAQPSVTLLKGKVVVVDGTNVMFGSSLDRNPSLLNLMGLLLELDKRESNFKCFLDANSIHTLKAAGKEIEARVLEACCQSSPDSFIIVSGGNRADDFLLDFAHSQNAPVISNDRFREYHDKYPWLTTNPKRRASFVVHSGIMQIATFAVQARIPATLDEVIQAIKDTASRK